MAERLDEAKANFNNNLPENSFFIKAGKSLALSCSIDNIDSQAEFASQQETISHGLKAAGTMALWSRKNAELIKKIFLI